MGIFNTIIIKTLPFVPKFMVGLVSKRYIAGETQEKAIEQIRKLNQVGAMATVDLLGEFVEDEKKVEETVKIYLGLLDAIAKEKLDSNVSIKPTSLGALFDKDLCFESIKKIVKKANELGNFVRIDMEDHPWTDFTLESYEKLREEFPENVGTVLQSYMKRTVSDVDNLSKEKKTNLRICKGIYIEPEEIAYKDGKEINQSYLDAIDMIFTRKSYAGIATHDDALIKGALELIEKHKLESHEYEFQMLLGVKPYLIKRFVEKGHRIRIYVPYGRDWYAYSMRRLKENPTIAGHVVKDFIPKFFMKEKMPL